FGIDAVALDDGSSPEQIKEWDSIGHLNLMLALEQSFDVSFSTEEIVTMQSVAEIKSVLLRYGRSGA
ncbi:MAG TPA: acyl carrier protein, partial [Blastocatellia bacterium]|nr:acyl carrier protein [Blastocatellia bacterium]